jgi:hypothetical protein
MSPDAHRTLPTIALVTLRHFQISSHMFIYDIGESHLHFIYMKTFHSHVNRGYRFLSTTQLLDILLRLC